MPVSQSIPEVLGERAHQDPDGRAFTFIDYELDPAGCAETVTWLQIYRRTQVVAAEVASRGSPGDRVAILAPQGLDYIAGFFGVIAAGRIAVPLPAPMYGTTHDERVAAALNDCRPVVILTTSAVVDDVVSCSHALLGSAPEIVEIDSLDFYAPTAPGAIGASQTKTALLQYTSGSTRSPTGVMVTHENAIANLGQMIADTFEDRGETPPPDTTVVSWLPFYHDLGLMSGVILPAVMGRPAVLMSPVAFLQKPARWMQQMARNTATYAGGPNFAYELAVRRTSDEDMAGLDLGHVHTLAFGAERVQAATIKRIIERFAHFNLPASALRPGYGLAEATVYATSNRPGRAPTITRFDYEKLTVGHAEPCDTEGSVELVGCGVPRAATVRVVDPETRVQNPTGRIGEIWLHGVNVAEGYWRNSEASQQTFGGKLVNPSPDTPQKPWLRTGDLGVISDGELFIVGRIKDLLIIDGRNHYPDDIEATIQKFTNGRIAAITVTNDRSEQLVVVAELKKQGNSSDQSRLDTIKREVTAAVSASHGVRITELVLVAEGSMPITTSGKIRRSACADLYRLDQLTRLDTPTRAVDYQ